MGRTFRRESRKFQEDFDVELPQELLDDAAEHTVNPRRSRHAKEQSRLLHDDAYAAHQEPDALPFPDDIPE